MKIKQGMLTTYGKINVTTVDQTKLVLCIRDLGKLVVGLAFASVVRVYLFGGAVDFSGGPWLPHRACRHS